MPAGGQGPTGPGGAVRGVVYDSTSVAPLPGADVFLWGTRHRARTAADGTFRIDSVPPGRYTAVFFHARLAELGVSGGGAEVRVRSGETGEVRLAVPSVTTILAADCAFEPDPEARLISGVPVVGRVRDGDTGVPYPGARVTLTWAGRGATPSGNLEVMADDGGWFRACAVPTAVDVGVVADFMGRSSLRREVVLERGSAEHLDLTVGHLSPAILTGRVIDVAADAPVEGVRISLRGTSLEAVTDREGSFRLRGVPPGAHALVVQHPPYEPLEQPVDLASGVAVSAEVRLVEGVLALSPLEVTVERSTQTDRAMGGLIVDRADIEKIADRVRDVSDLLREQRVGGLIVRRSGPSACVGFTTGQVRMRANRSCVPLTVFVDGVRYGDPLSAFLIPAESIDRMILYRPIEAGNLFGASSANGVLEIYTRR